MLVAECPDGAERAADGAPAILIECDRVRGAAIRTSLRHCAGIGCRRRAH
jgi:hypothetical protein